MALPLPQIFQVGHGSGTQIQEIAEAEHSEILRGAPHLGIEMGTGMLTMGREDRDNVIPGGESRRRSISLRE